MYRASFQLSRQRHVHPWEQLFSHEVRTLYCKQVHTTTSAVDDRAIELCTVSKLQGFFNLLIFLDRVFECGCVVCMIIFTLSNGMKEI